MKNKLSYITLLCITAFSLLWGTVQLNDIVEAKKSLINWDGYGYYLHLPSIFIYDDLTDYQKVHTAAKKYQINTDYQTRPLNDSIQYPVYPVGQALTWTPFFGLAHTIAKQTDHEADGFSAPYQIAILSSSILFIFLGFYFNRKLLLYFFSDKIVALAMLCIYLATNYLYYSHYEISITHVYLYGYLSIFLYAIYRYHLEKTKKHLWIAGICFGIGVLTRNSEVFWLFIPFFLGIDIKNIRSFQSFIPRIKQAFFFIAVSLLLYTMFQISYFKVSTNQWFVNGYGDHSFNLLEPHFYNCLLGFYKGWFIYTPIAVAFIVGLIFVYQKNKTWFYSILIYTALYIYLLISWDDWTYGSTFGFRPIVQSYSLLILPLAYTIQFFFDRVKWIGGILLLGIISLHLIQLRQYNTRIFLRENYSYAYYKRVFLKLKVDKHDRIVIDIPSHQFDKKVRQIRNIYTQTNPLIIPPTEIEKKYPITTISSDQDIRLQIHMIYSYFGDSYGAWNQPRLITQTKSNSGSSYWTGLRLPEIMRNKKRDTILFNQLIPGSPNDSLSCFLTTQVQDSIIIHELQIDEIAP